MRYLQAPPEPALPRGPWGSVTPACRARGTEKFQQAKSKSKKGTTDFKHDLRGRTSAPDAEDPTRRT